MQKESEYADLITPQLKLRFLDRQLDILWERFRELHDEVIEEELFKADD